MLRDELLTELRQLSRLEKLQVAQLLLNDIATEEALLTSGMQYEVWSPFDAAGAAETLLKMLQEDQKASHG